MASDSRRTFQTLATASASLIRGTPQVGKESADRLATGDIHAGRLWRMWDEMNASSRGRLRVDPVNCPQCGTTSSGSWLGWRAYRSDDPELDEPPALAFFCPACSEREFGPTQPG
jgi:hypothetical protein